MEVAFDLIWDRSYGSVSVDQICERAQVNKGSFYYFFKTKADLAIAAHEKFWQDKQVTLDQIFSPLVPALERISHWLRQSYEHQKQRAEQLGHACGCPYASIGSEIATQDERIRAKAEELMNRVIRYLESAITDAKQEGTVKVSNPRIAAEQLYSFVLGAILQSKIRNNVESLTNLEPAAMAIIGASSLVAA